MGVGNLHSLDTLVDLPIWMQTVCGRNGVFARNLTLSTSKSFSLSLSRFSQSSSFACQRSSWSRFCLLVAAAPAGSPSLVRCRAQMFGFISFTASPCRSSNDDMISKPIPALTWGKPLQGRVRDDFKSCHWEGLRERLGSTFASTWVELDSKVRNSSECIKKHNCRVRNATLIV